MKNYNEFISHIDQIEGWLTDKEAVQLFALAKKCTGDGIIVEIGSWKGKSTICLAKGSQQSNGVKIYAVDPHQETFTHKNWSTGQSTLDQFRENIKKSNLDELVVPIVKTSRDAANDIDKPVELIFIDGNHQYEAVREDLQRWFPKVKDGGIMAFHDTTDYDGPRRVVSEFVFRSKYFKHIHCIDSITFGQKTRQNSLFDRFRNRYLLCMQNLCIFMSKPWMPKPIRKLTKKIRRLLQPIII